MIFRNPLENPGNVLSDKNTSLISEKKDSIFFIQIQEIQECLNVISKIISYLNITAISKLVFSVGNQACIFSRKSEISILIFRNPLENPGNVLSVKKTYIWGSDALVSKHD